MRPGHSRKLIFKAPVFKESKFFWCETASFKEGSDGIISPLRGVMRHENELIWEADLWCNFLDEGWFVVTCLKSVCKHQSAVGWLVSLVGLVGLVGWLVSWLVGGWFRC